MKKTVKEVIYMAFVSIFTIVASGCGSDEPEQQNTDANGFEYVDLGLSVKWASCNVGAKSPEEPGFLFAWGEGEPKEIFKPDDYKYSEKSETGKLGYFYTKYCTDPACGTNDGITTLQKEDDAAHVNMGGAWRMPTLMEIAELMQNCKKEYVTVNESFCVKFIGPNGNFILLPGLTATMMAKDSSGYYHIRTDSPETGGIWSSTLCVLYEQAQWAGKALEFHSAYPSLVLGGANEYRWAGLAVRGVLE